MHGAAGPFWSQGAAATVLGEQNGYCQVRLVDSHHTLKFRSKYLRVIKPAAAGGATSEQGRVGASAQRPDQEMMNVVAPAPEARGDAGAEPPAAAVEQPREAKAAVGAASAEEAAPAPDDEGGLEEGQGAVVDERCCARCGFQLLRRPGGEEEGEAPPDPLALLVCAGRRRPASKFGGLSGKRRGAEAPASEAEEEAGEGEEQEPDGEAAAGEDGAEAEAAAEEEEDAEDEEVEEVEEDEARPAPRVVAKAPRVIGKSPRTHWGALEPAVAAPAGRGKQPVAGPIYTAHAILSRRLRSRGAGKPKV